MRAHRTEATVGGDGSVVVRDLPFAEGEAVEVIVLPSKAPAPPTARRPGSAKGLITVPDSFDDPIPCFEPYT